MERSNPETPRFISREERDHIEFYQGWLRTIFTEGLAGADELVLMRDRFRLDETEQRLLYQRDVDLEPFQAVLEEIQKRIGEEVHCAVRDIRTNVFKAGLFNVGIQVGEELWHIEDIAARGESILPVVNGEPYGGGIDDVLFDR